MAVFVLLAIGVAVAVLVTRNASKTEPSPPPPPLPPNPLPPCASKPSLQIIDGRPAEAGKWPWQVALLSNQKCGGSLIAPSWVLTAAHCIPKISPEKMNVTLGTITLTRNDPNMQRIPAAQFFVHPKYDDDSVANDVALVKLSRPATLNQFVSTVCLPSKQYNFGGKTLVATGWGRTKWDSSGTGSDALNETTVLAGTCGNIKVRPTEICTYTPKGGVSGGPTGTCQGDSGGPLVLQDGENWILVGITSYGAGEKCAQVPTFFQNVYSYLGWIFETINANP